MASSGQLVSILLITFLIALAFFDTAEAAYKRPPFNGSIFGKRNNVEYDNGKAVSAMCEIALEACSSWFPQESK